jgi:hypothetical protein
LGCWRRLGNVRGVLSYWEGTLIATGVYSFALGVANR